MDKVLRGSRWALVLLLVVCVVAVLLSNRSYDVSVVILSLVLSLVLGIGWRIGWRSCLSTRVSSGWRTAVGAVMGLGAGIVAVSVVFLSLWGLIPSGAMGIGTLVGAVLGGYWGKRRGHVLGVATGLTFGFVLGVTLNATGFLSAAIQQYRNGASAIPDWWPQGVAWVLIWFVGWVIAGVPNTRRHFEEPKPSLGRVGGRPSARSGDRRRRIHTP